MKGTVYVLTGRHSQSDADLAGWVDAAAGYALSLPAK